MKRRTFFTRSLGLVIAARCLPLLDADAMAMQLRPGAKPPLTEASLNAIIPSDTAGLRTLAGRMFPDMKAFIRASFTLAPDQERALSAISNATIQQIQTAVESAIGRGAKVSVTAVEGATIDLGVQVANAETRIVASGCQKLLIR
jgi:hypothetical protein